jgi:acyl-[acyl-carrier-protein]-phospholipid O-acyltransferase/long-chain-fatty-acid--[acyl-carrier-protein] ligase
MAKLIFKPQMIFRSTFMYYVLTLAFIICCLVTLLGYMAIFCRRRLVRTLVKPILTLIYRKEIVGLANLPKSGGVVIACNHQSWIDGILILWLLPRNVRFVVDEGNFSSALRRWLANSFDSILMGSSPKSIARALIAARKALVENEVVGIFPEGTISRTGQLQGFKPGICKMVKGTDAVVVPIYLHGMWGSIFSFSDGKFFFKVPTAFRRKITLYIDPALPTDVTVSSLRSKILAMSAIATKDGRGMYPNLPREVIRKWKKDSNRIRIVDPEGAVLSGRQLLSDCLALQRIIRRTFGRNNTTVGILMPPCSGSVLANVSLAIDRRVAVNLDYSLPSQVLNQSIDQVGIKTVLSTAGFYRKIDLNLGAEVILLEDLKDKIPLKERLLASCQATLLPSVILERILRLDELKPDDILTIMATTGVTNNSKKVLLTQANISHAVETIRQVIRANQKDVVICDDPVFDIRGYAINVWATMALGLLGVYCCYPHAVRHIGELSMKYGVTILFSDSAFLFDCINEIHPKQFSTLNVVVVKSEKMPAGLFDIFERRYGVRPVEGYGSTEIGPLAILNCPPSRSVARYQSDRLEGSVGRSAPGVAVRIVAPGDLNTQLPAGENGILLISGPNVTVGHLGEKELMSDETLGEWFVTGDTAFEDEMGFVHIADRASSF